MIRLRDSRGFSLIEVLISVGLVGLIALGLMQIFSNLSKTQKFSLIQHSVMQFQLGWTDLLFDPLICSSTFAGINPTSTDIATAPTVSAVKNKRNSNLISVNDAFDAKSFFLRKIQVMNFRAMGSGTDAYRGYADAFFSLESSSGSVLGPTTIVRRLLLLVELQGYSGGAPAMNIKNCQAVSNQFNVPWVRSSLSSPNQAISFWGNHVGIGSLTGPPEYRLHVAGNILASGFYHPSDRRSKDSVEPMRTNGLLEKIKAYTYRFSDSKNVQYGVLAQELSDILPAAVLQDNRGNLAVDYRQLIPLLVEAQKSLHAEINNQNLAILRQESEIQAIQRQLSSP